MKYNCSTGNNKDKMEIENLKKLQCSITQLWKGEEKDFSPWLAKHLTEISELTNTILESETLEKRVGKYEADIVAKDALSKETVVIENQYGKSNHDHLGKCLTYMSNIGAKILIWICEEFNDEHLTAIRQLNDEAKGEAYYFAISVNCYKAGDKGFYEFNLEEGAEGLNTMDNRKLKFWQEVEMLLPKPLKDKFTPTNRNYADFGKILSHAKFGMSVDRKGISKVYFYTDNDQDAKLIADKVKSSSLPFENSIGAKNNALSYWILRNDEEKSAHWFADTATKIYHLLEDKK